MTALFSTAVLDALEFDSMEPSEQQSLLLHLGELLHSSSLLRFMDALDEDARSELMTLSEQGATEEAMQAFFNRYPDESNKAVEDALAELTSDILTVTGHQPA